MSVLSRHGLNYHAVMLPQDHVLFLIFTIFCSGHRTPVQFLLGKSGVLSPSMTAYDTNLCPAIGAFLSPNQSVITSQPYKVSSFTPRISVLFFPQAVDCSAYVPSSLPINRLAVNFFVLFLLSDLLLFGVFGVNEAEARVNQYIEMLIKVAPSYYTIPLIFSSPASLLICLI